MTRRKPKGWPERGRLQIGFNGDDELERLRVLLRNFVYGPARSRYWVWAKHRWVQLCFNGTLANFHVRERHPTNPYKNAARGPMFEHVLVCDIVQGEVHALKECIELRLSFDSLLGVSRCYKGALVKRVWEFKESSGDHSLSCGKMRGEWLGEDKDKACLDEFEARCMFHVSISVTEDPGWEEDLKNPWKARYMIDVAKEPCGFQVGGGEQMHYVDGFASLRAAQDAGDRAKAALLTRAEMSRRDAFVREWQQWAQGKSNCGFRPIQMHTFDDATRFDPEEARDEAHGRIEQRNLQKVRLEREARQAARAATAAAAAAPVVASSAREAVPSRALEVGTSAPPVAQGAEQPPPEALAEAAQLQAELTAWHSSDESGDEGEA